MNNNDNFPPRPPPKKNTAVYVTNLPADVTLDELNEHFSKVGVIMDDMWTGGPRIKIYEDPEGILKGDALIVYLREESVQLAVNILDESQLRPGLVIHVQAATFDQTNSLAAPAERQPIAAETSSLKVDKATWKKRMRKMQRKLAWGETNSTGSSSDSDSDSDSDSTDESDSEKGKRRRQRQAKMKRKRTLVIRNMYEPEELAQDPAFLLELRQDLDEECTARIGPVTSIHILDYLGDEGICTVTFTTAEHARLGVKLMDGRFFAGRQLRASLYDGSFRLRERRVNPITDEDARIDNFGTWLEEQSSSSSSE